MPVSTLGPLVLEDFKIVPECHGGGFRLVVRFQGSADIKAREGITRYLIELHSEAIRLGTKEVVADFLELGFMNSSCIKAFVSWIDRIQGVPPLQRYTLRFVSNPANHWQKRSLHALKSFATDLVSIDILKRFLQRPEGVAVPGATSRCPGPKEPRCRSVRSSPSPMARREDPGPSRPSRGERRSERGPLHLRGCACP